MTEIILKKASCTNSLLQRRRKILVDEKKEGYVVTLDLVDLNLMVITEADVYWLMTLDFGG